MRNKLRYMLALITAVLGINVQAQTTAEPDDALQKVYSLEGSITTPAEATDIDNLTSGWYQIQYVGPGWTPAEYNKFLKTVNISDAINHNGDLYDLQTTDDQTAINTLVYIDNTGETGTTKDAIATTVTTFTLATGNGVGKGGSRTNFAANKVGITSPDADKTALGFYYTVSNNYGDVFNKATGISPLGAGATQKQVRFHLYKIDVDAQFDVYTVAYDAAITGTPTVKYNNADYTGVTEVIANGKFFVKKGETPTADQFVSAQSAGANTEVEIDADAKTITVKLAISPEELAAAIDKAQGILAKRGVGYPTTECAEYIALESAIAAAEAALTTPTVEALTGITNALTDYYAASGIELPQVGNYYRLNVISGASANYGNPLGYLTYDDAGVYVNDGTADDNNTLQCVEIVDGRYMFKFKTNDKYFAWKGSNAGENSDKGYVESRPDNVNYTTFTIAKLTPSAYVTHGYENTFGFVHLISPNRSETNTTAGCFVFQNNSKAFNSATAPFFNETYTSAFSIEKVEYIPTNINAADAANTDNVIYNINGQRVNKVNSGLYIINGQKVMVK